MMDAGFIVAHDFITDEGRKCFEIRKKEIELRAETEIQEAMREYQELEKEQIANDRARAVARALNAYMENGLPEEKAWELVKQESLMIPLANARFCK